MTGYNPTKDPLFKFRATGRTYRMLEAAAMHMIEGGRGFVMVGNYQQRERCIQVLRDKFTLGEQVNEHTFRHPSGGRIQFILWDNEDFNWDSKRIRGADPSYAVFVDHFAVEMKYGRAIVEWVRWT